MKKELTAWQRSHELVAAGQQSEVALQNAVVRRAQRLVAFMKDGHDRQEAERMAGSSVFGPRPRKMVDALVEDLMKGEPRVADPNGKAWTCVDCGRKTPTFHRCEECAESPRHYERFGGEIPAGVDW